MRSVTPGGGRRWRRTGIPVTGIRTPSGPSCAGLEDLGLRGTDAGRALTPRAALRGIGTMRFSTEVLPLLDGHPGVTVEISGEPADYREAGDSLRIDVSSRRGGGRH